MAFRIVNFIIIISIISTFGCGQDNHIQRNTEDQHSISFHLSPDTPAQNNVTEIELKITVSDAEPEFLRITNVNPGQHTARTSISVPVESSITLSAIAFDGICPVLRGNLENLEVSPEQNSPITIVLNPVQAVIGIRSNQQQISPGENWDVEIYIEDAPKLLAVTMELQFNEQLLTPIESITGGGFGSDAIFLEDSGFNRREENILSLGLARPSGNAGVCGSGVLFRITFEALVSGNASVRILRNNMFTLTTPDFERIDNSRIIIRPDISIEIR
ncbi:hypothetical protein GF312_07565 [Candidatus Poribacteria bacterium]|nr:hypothetical protein [Candidatus Poribacteria bacterium]